MPHVTLACVAALAITASSSLAQDVSYEPVPVYVFEESATVPGKPAQTRTIEEVGVSPFRTKDAHFPPQGFAQEKTKEDMTVGNRKFSAEKWIWTRDKSKGYPNLKVATLTIWRSDEVTAPAFTLPMKGMDLDLPAGCLRVESAPEPEGGADSLEVRVQWEKEADFKTSETSFKVHEYSFAWRKDVEGMTGRVTVSKNVDGGLCALSGERSGRKAVNGGQVLKSIRMLGTPAGIVSFRDAGFGFAPPEGYVQEKAGAGEVAAFRNATGATLRIALVDLGGKDFAAWWKAMMGARGDSFRGGMDYRSLAVTGSTCSGYESNDSGEMSFFFARAAQGYNVKASNGANLKPDDLQKLFAGWRWIKE